MPYAYRRYRSGVVWLGLLSWPAFNYYGQQDTNYTSKPQEPNRGDYAPRHSTQRSNNIPKTICAASIPNAKNNKELHRAVRITYQFKIPSKTKSVNKPKNKVTHMTSWLFRPIQLWHESYCCCCCCNIRESKTQSRSKNLRRQTKRRSDVLCPIVNSYEPQQGFRCLTEKVNKCSENQMVITLPIPYMGKPHVNQ